MANEEYLSIYEYYDYLIQKYITNLEDYSEWITTEELNNFYSKDKCIFYKVPFDSSGETIWATKEQVAIALVLKEALLQQYDRFIDLDNLILNDYKWYLESNDNYRYFCHQLSSCENCELCQYMGIPDLNKVWWYGCPVKFTPTYGDYNSFIYPVPYAWAKSWITQPNRFEGIQIRFEERHFTRTEESEDIPDFVKEGRKNLEAWYRPVQRYYLYHNLGQYAVWSKKYNCEHSMSPTHDAYVTGDNGLIPPGYNPVMGDTATYIYHPGQTCEDIGIPYTGRSQYGAPLNPEGGDHYERCWAGLYGCYEATSWTYYLYNWHWYGVKSVDTQDPNQSPPLRDDNGHVLTPFPYLGSWYEEDPFHPVDLCKICSNGGAGDEGNKNITIDEIWVRAYLVDSEENEITFDRTLDQTEGIQSEEHIYDYIINILKAIHEKIQTDGTWSYNLIYFGGRGEY